VKAYQDGLLHDAERNGYVTTLLGRRRYIPELSNKIYAVRAAGQRQAINHPIQGTASDIVKIAMLKVDDALRSKNFAARMVMQVHDELLIEAPEQEAAQVVALLKREMESAVELDVPLEVEAGTGGNWMDTKK